MHDRRPADRQSGNRSRTELACEVVDTQAFADRIDAVDVDTEFETMHATGRLTCPLCGVNRHTGHSRES